jgi:hypothetical protein
MTARVAGLDEIVTAGLADKSRLGAILMQCHPKQLAYVADASDKKAALCSRRAGKTQAKVRALVMSALSRPESIALYFATTIKSAKAIIWDNPDGLPIYLRKNKIDCLISDSEHRVTFPNGSMIWVTGAEGKAECERWRGMRTDLVDIDEAQAFPDDILGYLLDEVISPTQMDRGGQLSIGGTPDGRCRGYFHDATTGAKSGWSVHRWTWKDNPHLPNATEWVAKEKLSRGLTDESPAFRREFRGEWVREDSALAYRFEMERNTYDKLPAGTEWTTILGVDLGFNDAAAFSLGCYNPRLPTYFIREVYQEKGCIVSRYDEIIRSFKQANEINKIVMDCGALGKTIAEELRQRFHHFIVPAEKSEKKAAIALFNDSLRTGNIKVDPKRCEALVRQWGELSLDEDGDEDQTQANDVSDASLYSFRHARAYLFEAAPAPQPPPGRRPPPNPDVVAAAMMERAERYVERSIKAEEDTNGLLGDFEPLTDGLFE